jgi:hypothetical protein
LAHEILALTKLNWNTTQFDGGDPEPFRHPAWSGKYCASAATIKSSLRAMALICEVVAVKK